MAFDLSWLLGWLFPRPKPKPEPPRPDPEPPGPFEYDVLALVNAERKSRKLSILSNNEKLMNLAGHWAASMATSSNLTHGDFSTRFKKVYPERKGGEVISAGQSTSAQVVAAWMESTKHREILLDPDFRSAGVGRSGVKPAYWCMDLAGPAVFGQADIRTSGWHSSWR